MWPWLLPVVAGSILRCDKPLTLQPGGDYLLFELVTPALHSLLVTTTASNYNGTLSFSSANPSFNLDGYAQWTIRADIFEIKSVSETTQPPSEATHKYLEVVANVSYAGAPYVVRSTHFFNVVDICAEIIGKSLYQNAPILTAVDTHNPVDVLVQSPAKVAIISAGQIQSILTPTHHDAPRGILNYSDDGGNTVTIAVDDSNGVPINRIKEITSDLGRPVTVTLTGFDHVPVMALPYVQNYPGMVTSSGFEDNPVQVYESGDEAVVNYLNSVPYSRVHNIPITATHHLYFLFTAANPDGLLGSGITHNRKPEAIYTPGDCSSVVSVTDGVGSMVRLCLRQIKNDIVALSDTGIIKTVEATLPTFDICSQYNGHLRRSGHDKAVYVCTSSSSTVQSSPSTAEYDQDPDLFRSTVTYSGRVAFAEITIGGVQLSTQSQFEEDSNSDSPIHIVGVLPVFSEHALYYVHGQILKVNHVGITSNLDSEIVAVAISQIPKSDDDPTPDGDVLVSVVHCSPYCALTLYHSTQTPTVTSQLTTNWQDEDIIIGDVLIQQSNMPSDPTKLVHHRNNGVTTVPSVRLGSAGKYDVFVLPVVVDGQHNLARLMIDDALYRTSVPLLSLDSAPSMHSIGPLVVVRDNTVAYLFNLGTLVVVNATPPTELCHNDTVGSVTPAVHHAYSIGGHSAYAAQYLSSMDDFSVIDSYTTSDGYSLLYTDGVDRRQDVSTLCTDDKANLSTTTRYHALFPGAPSWCDTLDVDSDPLSPYLPGGSTTLQADETAVGGKIVIPSPAPTMHFSAGLHEYCDGGQPLPVHSQTDPTYIRTTVTRIPLPTTVLNCTTNRVQPMIGSPVALLLMETGTRTFYRDYPLCTLMAGEADPDDLPFVTGTVQRVAHLGRGVYGEPTATATVCDREFNYRSQTVDCEPYTICAADYYESVPGTATSDRRCAPQPLLTLGISYQKTPGTPTTRRVLQRVSQCPADHHRSVGPTLTSDAVCSSKKSCCSGGFRLIPFANDDAPPNQRNDLEPCVACPAGKNAYDDCENPPCASCHNQTSCTDNVEYYCRPGHWHDGDPISAVGHPDNNCRRCTTCLVYKKNCTSRADARCDHSPLLGAPVADCKLSGCPPKTYLHTDLTQGTSTCLPYRQCPHGWVQTEGTCTSDRVCATVSSEQYIYESIIGVYGGLLLAVAGRVWFNHEPSSAFAPEV